MSPIVFVAAMIASAMALAKNERILDRTGIFGSCSALAARVPEGGQCSSAAPAS